MEQNKNLAQREDYEAHLFQLQDMKDEHPEARHCINVLVIHIKGKLKKLSQSFSTETITS